VQPSRTKDIALGQRGIAEGLHFSFANASGSLRGSRPLRYFVGSGASARSYLIEDDGYLFEAPRRFTPRARDMAPRYESYSYPYLTRPVMPGCLGCHASFIAVVPGTQNRDTVARLHASRVCRLESGVTTKMIAVNRKESVLIISVANAEDPNVDFCEQ
jgi:hypothetical protein